MVSMNDSVRDSLANAIDDSFIGKWLNQNLRADVMLAKAKDTVASIKDGLSDAKDSVVAFAKDPLSKGKSEPEVAMEKSPKLGLSNQRAQALASAEGSSALGSHEVEAPSAATFASLSGKDLAHVNGIRDNAAGNEALKWDRVQVSQADIGVEGSISSVGVGTNYAQHQQNQAAQLSV